MMVFLIHLIGLNSLKNLKDGCIILIKFVLGLAIFIVVLNSKQAEKPAFFVAFCDLCYNIPDFLFWRVMVC